MTVLLEEMCLLLNVVQAVYKDCRLLILSCHSVITVVTATWQTLMLECDSSVSRWQTRLSRGHHTHMSVNRSMFDSSLILTKPH